LSLKPEIVLKSCTFYKDSSYHPKEEYSSTTHLNIKSQEHSQVKEPQYFTYHNPPQNIKMAGLLGNLTNSLDNTLTGGDQAKGQGGLLGSVTGAVGKTVDGAGNVVGQTTDGLGNVVGQTTNGVANTAGQTTNGLANTTGQATNGVANTAGGLTNTAGGLVGGATGQQQKRA